MASDDRAEKLYQASDDDEVLYLSLLRFKGAKGRSKLLLVEGHDDVTFADAVMRVEAPALRSVIAVYNCKGKGNVFKLYDMIDESQETELNQFWFMIDRDFDYLRGRPESARVWVTPGYSFENILVSREVLSSLLHAEYRCADHEGVDDARRITKLFDDFISSYKQELFYPNLCAYYAIRCGVKLKPHEESISPKINMNFPSVILELSEVEIREKMGKDVPLREEEVQSFAEEFAHLDPVNSWRGKFLFSAFIQFLDELRKDRGSKRPQHFSTKAGMNFNPRTDAIRTLTSVAELPDSLISFVRSIEAA
jgi:hypothetical protein